jgi:adenine-specific DNA methylase
VEPNSEKTGVVFGIETGVPAKGSNAAQKRENDKKIGKGTMTRAGADCPCCGLKGIMTMEDIRTEAKDPAKQLGAVLTAVAIDGLRGKEYRLPTDHELATVADAVNHFDRVFARVPFGIINEPTPVGGGTGAGRAFSVQGYGMMKWRDLFTPRQLIALGTLVIATRSAHEAMLDKAYPDEWAEAISAYLACGIDRLVDFANVNTQWKIDVPTINHAVVRFAIQITWDFAEGNPVGELAGSYPLCLERVVVGLVGLLNGPDLPEVPIVHNSSAQKDLPKADIIITDPPYYDAIPYSDLMDWFYVWLRRAVFDLSDDYREAMRLPTAPKWNPDTKDGELIDDSSRHGGDAAKSKKAYEDGMAASFRKCSEALSDRGRLVIVFANKQPDAWETLVESVIRSGFIVEGSWPIQTEQPSRMRGISSAALASSVWLVCQKRLATARPGWDNKVLDEMRANIGQQLREFWDAGIRGPDFVWAATGPALEAYSKHPVVKMADEPGKVMTVSDFLSHARRMVVDYVVGRVLSGDDADAAPPIDRLDEPTAYYLLHRHDFGLEDAPAGACILYATACGLSDDALIRDWDLIVKTGGEDAADDDEDEEKSDESDEPSEESGSGSKVKLKAWNHRRGRSLGLEAPGGRPVPLIDRIHRLMQLWKGGDVHKVDEYLDEHGLRRHELFRRVLQSLIELSRTGGEERSLLESLSNHVGAKGAKKKNDQPTLLPPDDADE